MARKRKQQTMVLSSVQKRVGPDPKRESPSLSPSAPPARPKPNFELYVCPICHQLLQDVVVTKCMHRFCRDCLKKSLDKCRRECPSCRTSIIHMRHTSHDHLFEQVIQSHWLTQEDFEADWERHIQENSAQDGPADANSPGKENKNVGHSQNGAGTNSTSQAVSSNQEQTNEVPPTELSSQDSSTFALPRSIVIPANTVKVTMEPVPGSDTELVTDKSKFLQVRINRNVSILHISKYLERKFQVEPCVDANHNELFTYPFSIYIQRFGKVYEYEPMESCKTLRQLIFEYPDAMDPTNEIVPLYYTYRFPIPKRQVSN